MSDIAEVLKSVPAVKLRIIPLTWELLGKDGQIDIKKASFRATEVEKALAKAENYVRLVDRALVNLKRLG